MTKILEISLNCLHACVYTHICIYRKIIIYIYPTDTKEIRNHTHNRLTHLKNTKCIIKDTDFLVGQLLEGIK